MLKKLISATIITLLLTNVNAVYANAAMASSTANVSTSSTVMVQKGDNLGLLNETQMKINNRLKEAIANRETSVTFYKSDYDFSLDFNDKNNPCNFATRFNSINPELATTYELTAEYSKDWARINIKYYYSKEESERMQQEFDKKLSEIAMQVSNNGKNSQVDTIYNLVSYFTNNVKYDTESEKKNNAEHKVIGWTNDIDFINSQTAYGAIMRGKAVCGGYTNAATAILNRAGFKNCIYVLNTDWSHAWNLIPVNGKYYHCDFTWSNANDKVVSKCYLLCSDDSISKFKHHVFNKDEYIDATDTAYDRLFNQDREYAIKNYKE